MGRLPRRLTGKEEDVEVGLQYFGKRYLNAQLGRWISAAPLAVHAPGEADLNVYAYVSGHVLKSVDPLGSMEESATFKAWYRKLIEFEGGGYHNKPNDRGGPTNDGITLDTCRRMGSCGYGLSEDAAHAVLKNATRAQTRQWANQLVSRTYRANDFRETGVGLFMADAPWGGIDESRVTAALRAAGSSASAALEQPSGRWTDETVSAINAVDPNKFLDAYHKELRQQRIETSRLPGQAGHRAGWVARVDTRYTEAKILLGDALGAARWLNGRSLKELEPVVNRLDQAELASLHEAAISEGSGLGGNSRIAQKTEAAYLEQSSNGGD